MSPLFTTTERELNQFLKGLTEDSIQDYSDPNVYYRGEEYYEADRVTDAAFNKDKTFLTATVKGSRNYRTEIQLRGGAVSGVCTCPYGDLCKHIIATLLFAIHEIDNIEILTDKNNDSVIKDYLHSLPKGELVSLILKYAPKQFFTRIDNSLSNNSEAQKIFKKTERAIQNIFNNDELLYSPDGFDKALIKEINKLSGLEKLLKEDLRFLIIDIIKKVDNAFDEGYLYDQYNDYNFEPSEEFDKFIVNYVCVLNYKEKTEFLSDLNAAIGSSSYDTFHTLYHLTEKVFTEQDLPLLKTMLINDYKAMSPDLVENYYRKVAKLLSSEERKSVLSVLKDRDSSWIVELTELIRSEGKGKEAITVLKKWLSTNSTNFMEEDVYFLYLDLLKEENFNLQDAAKESISRCPTSAMVQKIASLLPEEITIYEKILEQKNVDDLLDYLETSGRLQECLALIKRKKTLDESNVYSFFKKNKKEFPEEAGKYFCEVIDKNLKETGDRFYHTIAKALEELKKINPTQASELLFDIKLNYKRRSKLMSIIAKL